MIDSEAPAYNGGKVEPGETQDIRYGISETYLGDPVRIPVTIINGEPLRPTVSLFAAARGDGLNGIEAVREVAYEWDPADLADTLACMPVMNISASLAQQRYLPIYDRNLNRSLPDSETSTGAKRMAHRIYQNFIASCDLGIDFHTSTRGRADMLHVRAGISGPAVARFANAFGLHVVIDSSGSSGMLRTGSSVNGMPTITIEMDEAYRFQRELIDEALVGVEDVFVEYDLRGTSTVNQPSWCTVIFDENEKAWLRVNAGGIVDVHHDRGALVHEGDRICTITNPLKDDNVTVVAPFTGLLVGILENPVIYPGNLLCHLVELKDKVRRVVEREQSGSPEATR